MYKNWMGVLVLFSAPLCALAGDLELRIGERVLKSFTQADLEALAPVMALPVKNPVINREVIYEGIPLSTLLQSVYGDQIKNYDAVQFVSEDGYEPVMPLAAVSKHFGLVAWRDLGAEGLLPLSGAEGGTVNLGSYFVVWENLKDVDAARDAWVSWPWQLTSIRLTTLDSVYRDAAPPSGSSPDVRNGFSHFQQHCLKCHSVNGSGGSTGPELNFPASVTEYWQRNWLRAYISDPESVRHGGKMTPLPGSGAQRLAMVEEIVRYLEVMARHKKKPVEESIGTPSLGGRP